MMEEDVAKTVITTLKIYLSEELPLSKDFFNKLACRDLLANAVASELSQLAELGKKDCIWKLLTYMEQFYTEEMLLKLCVFLEEYAKPARAKLATIASRIRQEISKHKPQVPLPVPEDTEHRSAGVHDGRKRPAATSGTTEAKKTIPSPGPDLAGRPTTEDLRNISRAAGRKRKDLLRSLDIEEATIETLFDDSPNNAEEACYQGLLFWESEEALKPVTWGTLIDALKKAKLTKLVIELLQKVNLQLQQQDPSPMLSDQSGSGKPPADYRPPASTKTDASIPYISSVETFMEHFKEDFLNSKDVDPMAIVGRLEDDKLMPVAKCSQVKSDFDPYNKRATIYRHMRDQGTYSTLLGLCKAMKAASANKKTIALGERMQKVLEQSRHKFPAKESDYTGKREPEDYVDGKPLKVIQDLEQCLGHHFEDIVNNAACITLSISKCTTIGPPRVGKTCLKNLLIGQQWSQSDGTASTDAMEAPEWVEVHCHDEGTFKLFSRDNRKQQLMNDVTGEKYDLEDKSNKDTSSMDTSNEEQEDLPASQVLPTKSDLNQPKVTDKKPEEVSAAAKKLEEMFQKNNLHQKLKDAAEESAKGLSLQDRNLLYFIDTGGQRIFHDIHPVLITSPSVYLVVIDLHAMAVKMGYQLPNKPFSDLVPVEDPLEIADRALRSIYTFTRKPVLSEVPGKSGAGNFRKLPFWPKVFIVGTHLDLIDFRESRDKKKRKECLQAINDKIKKMISGKIYAGYVQFDLNLNCFWAVDNTVAGHADLQKKAGVDSYLGTMRNAILGRSIVFKVKVPVKWLIFEHLTSNVSHISYNELHDFAKDRQFCTDEKEFDLMLQVFHTLGLYYFKVPCTFDTKKSDSIVFTDPGILYKATSELFLSAGMQVKKTGMKMLCVYPTIQDLVRKKRFVDINIDSFTSLLCDLRLMAKIHGKCDPPTFIIPAALPSRPSTTEDLPFSAEPLVITFIQPGSLARIPFLPSGLFCAFISDLLADDCLRDDDGQLTNDRLRHDDDQLFREAVSFHFHEGQSELGLFVLSEEDCYIKVVFRANVTKHKLQSDTDIARCCIRIRKYLKTRLTVVWHKVYEEYKIFNLGAPGRSSECEKAITFGFHCSVHKDISEYIEVKGKGCYTHCLSWRSPVMRSVPRRQSVWFTQNPYGEQSKPLSTDNQVLVVPYDS